MRCPLPEQLAVAAAGEDDVAFTHAMACIACRRVLDEQREVRDLFAVLPAPALTRDRRAAMAAEVMACVDARPARTSRRIAIGIGLAAAAAVALAFGVRERAARPAVPEVALREELVLPTRGVNHVDEDPPPLEVRDQRARVTGAAEFRRSTVHGRDIVDLHDGELTVDSRKATPVEIAAGRTRVRVSAGNASVVARGGVVQTVTVFAGSAEITSDGKHHVIEAGAVWQPVFVDAASLEAFRNGWEALRAARHGDAIAAFDRAIDPIVAEDAVYWAAVAAERAGQRDDAKHRYLDFLVRFGTSPRVEAARAAVERLRASP